MEFSPTDKIDLENLIKCLKRAKFDGVAGVEMLAFSRMYILVEKIKEYASAPKPEPVVSPPVAPPASPVAAAMSGEDPFKVFNKELDESVVEKKVKGKKKK